ncbi:hypothetical protein L6R50_08885 [Myxococcota bacterium]|nr:hypothetical protein [Myxococcota bacterium]
MRRDNLIFLGYTSLFRDPATRELLVDTDGLRQRPEPEPEFGDEDEDWDDDEDEDDEDAEFGDEDGDFEGDDDDEFGDEDDEFGDEDDGAVEGEDDDEFGATRRRRRNKRNRSKSGKSSSKRRGSSKKKGRPDLKVETMESGSASATFAGAGTESFVITIRVQEDLFIEDFLTEVTGGLAKITDVKLGGKTVFSSNNGASASNFAASSRARGFFKNQVIGGGRDIVIKGTLSASGAADVSLEVTFKGRTKQLC